jgi:hypothetical protein
MTFGLQLIVKLFDRDFFCESFCLAKNFFFLKKGVKDCLSIFMFLTFVLIDLKTAEVEILKYQIES